jgi:ABC-type sugar transport system ATPase subunit
LVQKTDNNRKIVLKLENIKKTFGGIHALKGVDFTLREGEVHALLGENGAGKSTLIKILTGVHKMDTGRILINGNEVEVENPISARFKGIAAIYQELSLVESLNVAQNIYLGHEPVKNFFGAVDFKSVLKKSLEYLQNFGIDIHPNTCVKDLGMGEKRIVEIVKALSIDARILVLDEPTTGMSAAEIDTLFRIMDDMKKKNVNMIYITHHLEEVFRICDRASVFRDGDNAGTYSISEVETATLVKAMLGKELKDEFSKRKGTPLNEEMLRVENFRTERMKRPVSFSVKKGEILGITGIIGAGKSELGFGLFGVDKRKEGQIFIKGKSLTINSPIEAQKNGIAFIPEDRKELGLFLDLSVEHNITITTIKDVIRNSMVSVKRRAQLAEKTAEKLKVKPLNIKMAAQNLSGGNQQKIVLGKWLAGRPEIIILDEPTRGIDVGAKSEIYRIIQNLADEGVAVIVLSAEFKEVNGVCDRIMILRKGEMIEEFMKENASTEKILSAALGG